MSADPSAPTPHADVNAILRALQAGVQDVLGARLVGMYLDGSLASGGFDQASDIDFVVVTDEDVSAELFEALRAMHDRIASLDSPWAIELEGSYLSRRALRRYDPANRPFPNIERGEGERLKWVEDEPIWNVHRHILRERGIVLLGPHPESLVDPVSPGALRDAMGSTLQSWGANFLEHPEAIPTRGYQSYIVLTLCRILYTLETGTLTSKLDSMNWARESAGERWQGLIERAWESRSLPQCPAEADEIHRTLEFIRFVMARAAVDGPFMAAKPAGRSLAENK